MTELLDIFDLYGSINKVTGHGLGYRGSIFTGTGIFLFATTVRKPIRRVLSSRVKRLERETDN